MSTNPHDHFTAFCNSLRREGGEHSGKTNIVAIAYDGDLSVTMESFPPRATDPDMAWHGILKIAVNRYLDVWAGDSFDYERAITSLEDDIAEWIDAYRAEHNMNEEGEV